MNFHRFVKGFGTHQKLINGRERAPLSPTFNENLHFGELIGVFQNCQIGSGICLDPDFLQFGKKKDGFWLNL